MVCFESRREWNFFEIISNQLKTFLNQGFHTVFVLSKLPQENISDLNPKNRIQL